MSDAVQSETYQIDGVDVSNFILPLYFTGTDEYDGRNDFLGTVNADGSSLKSFGVNPGGYIGFFDPETGKDHTFSKKGDAKAKKRMEIKSKLKGARRSIRYKRHSGHQKKSVKLAAQERN